MAEKKTTTKKAPAKKTAAKKTTRKAAKSYEIVSDDLPRASNGCYEVGEVVKEKDFPEGYNVEALVVDGRLKKV